jgi:hypothetical protein
VSRADQSPDASARSASKSVPNQKRKNQFEQQPGLHTFLLEKVQLEHVVLEAGDQREFKVSERLHQTDATVAKRAVSLLASFEQKI